METSYNFLLGRPWIHVARAIPYTPHHMIKFEQDNQEIVVHGEDEQSIYRDPSIPCHEVREAGESIFYQDFEIVVADRCEKGTPLLQPYLSATSVISYTNSQEWV